MGQLRRQVFRELDQLFKVFRPKRSIFIAVDGPTSVAKLVTQRKRRLAHKTRKRVSHDGAGGCRGTMGCGGGCGPWWW